MIEFQCQIDPPKYLVRAMKHRFLFVLNETDAAILPVASRLAENGTWLFAHVVGKNLDVKLLGQISAYRIKVDKGIALVFNSTNGTDHVEQMLKAHLSGDWVKVTLEETEAPYGMEKGAKRKTVWDTSNQSAVKTE